MTFFQSEWEWIAFTAYLPRCWVHFMSMENMMFNMYDYPELFKEMMDRIAEDTLAYYKFLEEKRLILPTVSYEGVGQGT